MQNCKQRNVENYCSRNIRILGFVEKNSIANKKSNAPNVRIKLLNTVVKMKFLRPKMKSSMDHTQNILAGFAN